MEDEERYKQRLREEKVKGGYMEERYKERQGCAINAQSQTVVFNSKESHMGLICVRPLSKPVSWTAGGGYIDIYETYILYVMYPVP